MKKIISIVIAMCFFIVNASTVLVSAEGTTTQVMRTISGKVYLPSGYLAPLGGVPITMEFSSGEAGQFVKNLLVPANSSYVNYKISVPKTSISGGYSVQYYFSSDMDFTDKFESYGYYSATETTYYFDKATLVDVGSKSKTGINLSIKMKRKMTGVISLPGKEKAPAGGLTVGVHSSRYVDNKHAHGWRWSSIPDKTYTIPAGKNSVYYTFYVSTVSGDDGKTIFKYTLTDLLNKYVEHAYYSNIGCNIDINNATVLNFKSSNKSNINFNILSLTN